MSLKRKRDNAQSINIVPSACWQTSSTVTTTASSSFIGFPSAASSAAGVFAGFQTNVMPTTNQNVYNPRRLRAPSSAVITVQQEDVRDIAGLYRC